MACVSYTSKMFKQMFGGIMDPYLVFQWSLIRILHTTTMWNWLTVPGSERCPAWPVTGRWWGTTSGWRPRSSPTWTPSGDSGPTTRRTMYWVGLLPYGNLWFYNGGHEVLVPFGITVALVPFRQCFGSGWIGSVCFLGLPYPSLFCYLYGSGSFHQ